MAAPNKIKALVERFVRNRDAYISGGYNEAQVRQEFINPMFIELGWDIYNEAGFAEAYKDVVHEDSLRIGGAHKAPDYSFRVGGRRKFFLEAKKPSVNIMDDIHPAYQTRRYAWSAKLPLSILTDFDEFAVYDCRVKPLKSDKASTARIIYFKHTELEDKWDEIQSIFSKDAVYKGDYDKYVESTKKKRGTTEVDDTFLKEIERWREMLAKSIAVRNGKLDEREINFVLGRTIDRIIFLRMCEDRGIEDYGRLQSLQNGTEVYSRLKQIYYLADERFNSGLFHFREEKDIKEPPDDLSLNTSIDDKPLKEIFKHLYYPDSPFEFSVLPPAILGQVYEQFLGKVIRLTRGHQAIVEYKPEVKKAGGVYYTPEYIVEYIVKNTVGKVLQGKSLVAASKLKIVDPACGSGSFLLNAYQYLLDWHLKKYSENPGKSKKVIFKGLRGEWRLTTAERKRILLNNIYGVDIDAQAVEVTNLSLLLKVLEGETGETLQRSLKLYHERALPNLSENIKCGNSLIGSDFYDNQELDFLDDEERYRINVFDWETEFPEIFSRKNPGFNIVIGNPPWGAEFSETEKIYHKTHYSEIVVRMIDSFMYFVFKSARSASKGGHIGMILPDVLLYQIDNSKLRKVLVEEYRLKEVLNLGDVFEKVTRPSCIIIFQNLKPSNTKSKIANFTDKPKNLKSNAISNTYNYTYIKQSTIKDLPRNIFITNNLSHYKILSKLKSVPHNPLSDLLDSDKIQRGVSPDLKRAYIVDKSTIEKYKLEKGKLRATLTGGKQVSRYSISSDALFVIYNKRNDDFSQIPNICKYIDLFRDEITCKEVKSKKHSLYSLHRPRKEEIFKKNKKIIGVITSDRIKTTIDKSQFYVTDGLFLFSPSSHIEINYILGLFNSKLLTFIYRLSALESGRVLAQVKPTILEDLPIRSIDFRSSEDKKLHDPVVENVKQILQLNKDLQEAKTSHKKEVIQRQINATDKQIDKLVYKLYDLTDEEIAIIEKGTA